jgi:hypothetical protein
VFHHIDRRPKDQEQKKSQEEGLMSPSPFNQARFKQSVDTIVVAAFVSGLSQTRVFGIIIANDSNVT